MASPIGKTRLFLEETGGELKRSSWPTRKELVDSTIIVIVSMLLMGVFVACADFVFVRLVRLLTTGAL
jgi:preprotein translocase subunit SecE